jgi:transposase
MRLKSSGKKGVHENSSQGRRSLMKKKIELIKIVFRRHKPLDEAIKTLGFKKTTAVNIINRFKETGELPFRKFKKAEAVFKEKENLSQRRGRSR